MIVKQLLCYKRYEVSSIFCRRLHNRNLIAGLRGLIQESIFCKYYHDEFVNGGATGLSTPIFAEAELTTPKAGHVAHRGFEIPLPRRKRPIAK